MSTLDDEQRAARKLLTMDANGVFYCPRCKAADDAAAITKVDAPVGNPDVDYFGKPLPSTTSAVKAVQVVLSDGHCINGKVTRQDWGRILEGKLQSFVLHMPYRRVIRWWGVRYVDEVSGRDE